jgi:predicted dehydrogenase
MSETLRTAVIGAGWWATDNHIPGILSCPGAELGPVCDPHAGRLAAAAKAYPIPRTFADYRDMLALDKPDAAIIVTPHATHYEIARDCLEAGLHILVEKPLTLHARDARDLVDLAAQNKRVLTLGYAHNFIEAVRRAREVVQGGHLGALQYVEATFSSDMTGFLGGAVSDEKPPHTRFAVNPPSENYNRPDLLGGGHGHLQLTHTAGVLFHVSGLRVKTVQARMAAFGRAVDMAGAFSIEFQNGALGILGGTGATPGISRVSQTFYGEHGMIWMDSSVPKAFLRFSDGRREELDLHSTYATRYSTTHNFIETALGKADSQAPGEVGLRAVELLDAAYCSAREGGRPVDVDELYS